MSNKKSIWQFIKFVLVSCLATVIQLALVNILYFMMKGFTTPLPAFLAAVFNETTVGEGNANWGYMLPFFLSNLIANTVGYFINRSKTFKSDAPIWHFALYIVILFALIVFSTWLQGVIVNALNGCGVAFFVGAAPTIASMAAGTLQLIILFPIQKYVLLREKKENA